MKRFIPPIKRKQTDFIFVIVLFDNLLEILFFVPEPDLDLFPLVNHLDMVKHVELGVKRAVFP